jgi:general secretion pathway protein G
MGQSLCLSQPGVNDDFDISSYGADGTPGGEGIDKDINSWEID